MGTDVQGRDVLAQLIRGTTTSLTIGVIAASIASAIAIIIGAVSGYKGGILDESLMAFANIVLAFPTILLLLVVAVFVPVRSPLVVAVLIGFTAWPGLARAIRAQIMSLKEREFVFLSRMAGWSGEKIVVFDLIPNMMAYVFTSFVVIMSIAMLAEAGLTMIGVGVTQGVSLGVMLFWAQMSDAVRRGLYWLFVPPGGVLTLVSASLLLLATALDQMFNPRLRAQ
ncbi:MAG: ABC transporter permease [Candidatus Bipolaricaulota bacterium]|nr:ABC transporter permease [Candidatus Bipolaricaulota bacterium]MDW8127064.1 ABC transporter permease [Candidatus Bipolaricaulota bacterium]